MKTQVILLLLVLLSLSFAKHQSKQVFLGKNAQPDYPNVDAPSQNALDLLLEDDAHFKPLSDYLFEQIDYNQNGVLSEDEFSSGVGYICGWFHVQPPHPEEISQVFHYVDGLGLHQDGVLSQEEFLEALKMLGEHVQELRSEQELSYEFSEDFFHHGEELYHEDEFYYGYEGQYNHTGHYNYTGEEFHHGLGFDGEFYYDLGLYDGEFYHDQGYYYDGEEFYHELGFYDGEGYYHGFDGEGLYHGDALYHGEEYYSEHEIHHGEKKDEIVFDVEDFPDVYWLAVMLSNYYRDQNQRFLHYMSDRVFVIFDSNHDGLVNLEEAILGLSYLSGTWKMNPPSYYDILKAFHARDLDESHTVSQDEFYDAFFDFLHFTFFQKLKQHPEFDFESHKKPIKIDEFIKDHPKEIKLVQTKAKFIFELAIVGVLNLDTADETLPNDAQLLAYSLGTA